MNINFMDHAESGSTADATGALDEANRVEERNPDDITDQAVENELSDENISGATPSVEGDNERIFSEGTSFGGGDGSYGENESNAENSDDENGIKVALDWVELEAALENNSPELHSFLNNVTGDVIRIFEGTENADTRLKQAEASPDFIYIDPISSRDQYHWMEEFIEVVEEPTLKDKLNIAIDGKGAFRRFKDVLVGYPAERERWFAKRSLKLREHMQTWLKSKRIIATNTPPWEGGDQERQHRSSVDTNGGARPDQTGDLRARAHEILDIVPSRELPIAVAFLEFLRNRRDSRRGRFSG